MPKLRGPIKDALDAISLTVAKEGKKESMWINEDKFPEIEGIKVVRPTLYNVCRTISDCSIVHPSSRV